MQKTSFFLHTQIHFKHELPFISYRRNLIFQTLVHPQPVIMNQEKLSSHEKKPSKIDLYCFSTENHLLFYCLFHACTLSWHNYNDGHPTS